MRRRRICCSCVGGMQVGCSLATNTPTSFVTRAPVSKDRLAGRNQQTQKKTARTKFLSCHHGLYNVHVSRFSTLFDGILKVSEKNINVWLLSSSCLHFVHILCGDKRREHGSLDLHILNRPVPILFRPGLSRIQYPTCRVRYLDTYSDDASTALSGISCQLDCSYLIGSRFRSTCSSIWMAFHHHHSSVSPRFNIVCMLFCAVAAVVPNIPYLTLSCQ